MKIGDKARFETPDGKARVGKIVKVMKVNVKLEAGRGENKREFIVKKDKVNPNPELGALPSKPVKNKPSTPPSMKKPRGAKKNRASRYSERK